MDNQTLTRIIKFTSLTSLNLDNFPVLVGYIWAHMDVPAIISLKIPTEFSPWEVEFFLLHTEVYSIESSL